jgi:hypothetical protein
MTTIVHPEQNPLDSFEGMILARPSGLSRLNSLIREVFVSDSHPGRMALGDTIYLIGCDL